MLNGFLILVAQGSLFQLILAVVVSLLYCLVLLVRLPMQELTKSYFVSFTSLMLCFFHVLNLAITESGGRNH